MGVRGKDGLGQHREREAPRPVDGLERVCGGKTSTHMAPQLLASGPCTETQDFGGEIGGTEGEIVGRDVELVGFEIPPNRQPSRDKEEPLRLRGSKLGARSWV